ncbi:MAG: glycosyltransferase [Chloroflexota bacterium]
MQRDINARNTVFVLISFEGPDCYSLAGGLGVRVTNLSNNLVKMGFLTHLFFIGDPGKDGEALTADGRLVLHRWCQWISAYYPLGVYQGENEKLYDFNQSIPGFVVQRIVKPMLSLGKLVVIMGEEWHTAEAMCRISDELQVSGFRDRVVMFWNANNTFGFERVDWERLENHATITTVSKYMKHIMWGLGVNPLVIPNGIPKSLLEKVDTASSARLKENVGAELMIAKVARWDPDKCWDMAVGAVARLKNRGIQTVLLARGGIEPHGVEVMSRACSLGLNVKDVSSSGNTLEHYYHAIGYKCEADILSIKFHCPQNFLRIIYNASDAVLANSGHEPFGLVGLEAMAAGGIAFIGSTGEDYAIPFRNSIVIETADPKEIESYIMYLQKYPEEGEKLRRAARQTAGQFTWGNVIENLIKKLEYQSRAQGLLTKAERRSMTGKPSYPPQEIAAGVSAPVRSGKAIITR